MSRIYLEVGDFTQKDPNRWSYIEFVPKHESHIDRKFITVNIRGLDDTRNWMQYEVEDRYPERIKGDKCLLARWEGIMFYFLKGVDYDLIPTPQTM